MLHVLQPRPRAHLRTPNINYLDNAIGAEGAAALAPAIGKLQSLTSLYLGCKIPPIYARWRCKEIVQC